MHMWTRISTWFQANRSKIFEFGVMIIAALAVLFSIWYAGHQRVTLAQQVGALEQAQVQHQRDMEAAKAENDRLQLLLDKQAADIQSLLAGAQSMNDRLSTIRTEADRRITTINRHDLQKIGSRKPKLLEDHINTGTRDLFGRLRDLTK